MDLDAAPFRAFVKVAEHASFTRAAAELNISQPALSAMIKEMERRLGFRLFERTSRRVSLTREGRALITNAKRVVLEHDWALQRAREIVSNDLRLAAPLDSTLIAERAALTESFAERHPKARIEVAALSPSRLYEAMRADEADLALTLEPTDGDELSPINARLGVEFETCVLATRRVGLLAPPGHPLFGRGRVPATELRGMRIAVVGRVHGGPLASSIGRWLAEVGAEGVRAGEADAISLMRLALRTGVAAIDIGWFEMARPAVAPALAPVAIAGPGPASDLVMLRRPRPPRPLAERFWTYAAARAEPVPA